MKTSDDVIKRAFEELQNAYEDRDEFERDLRRHFVDNEEIKPITRILRAIEDEVFPE